MTTEQRPVIVITMGDAAGIGPEVVAKALGVDEVSRISRPLVIGESGVMTNAVKLTKKPLEINIVKGAGEVTGKYDSIDLLDLNNLNSANVVPGKISADCGRAAMEYITKAAELTLDGSSRALVTAPINKEATKMAGYEDIGHLEYLARITNATEYATMLATGPLRVVHLTTHYSLKEACDLVTRERILAKLQLTHDSFRKWGAGTPSIAVAALNPHGSEGGLFGNEESREIGPAITDAHNMGIDARGPFPADSVFNRAINGEFDVVLALYHDQGHIPVKVHGLEKSVSVALGLPFIRTSVDHGTAFEIAGKGIADAESMVEAIKTAVRLIS
ncbi:4-hydroxythreonine-4-phosphate dehydrogenase PdxA [Chloroflexota bacterium]